MNESFESRLLRRIAVGQLAFERRNYDWLRYGASRRRAIIDTALGMLNRFGFHYHDRKAHAKNVEQHLKELAPHLKGLSWLHDRLADESSRQSLVDVIAYRILGARHIKIKCVHERFWQAVSVVLGAPARQKRTQAVPMLDGWLDDYDLTEQGYPVHMRAHRLNVVNTFLLEQYRFRAGELQIGVKADDVVVDGGGCWGDTALYFAHHVGSGGQVHAFEFSPDNLALFKRNLKENPSLKDRIRIHEFALWDNSTDTLSFDEAGPGTTLGAGTMNAATQSIDDWADRNSILKVDFIKLDIEGAEGRALKGARTVIASQHPTLAVALYHSLDDFTALPRLIDEIAPGYDFHLGHYTIHTEETVLFAVKP